MAGGSAQEGLTSVFAPAPILVQFSNLYTLFLASTYSRPKTTIGSRGLNFRVRNENGCDPSDETLGTLHTNWCGVKNVQPVQSPCFVLGRTGVTPPTRHQGTISTSYLYNEKDAYFLVPPLTNTQYSNGIETTRNSMKDSFNRTLTIIFTDFLIRSAN